MSQRNLEAVRALLAGWNAVELESPFSSVVGEPYRGYAGIEQWMHDLDEQFAE
jgi:hypothetical protein